MSPSDSKARLIAGIVTALLEEAQAFRPGKGEVDPTLPFYCRRAPGFIISCSGIGKVNASMAATCLLSNGANLLISMGAAGRLVEGPTGAHWVTDAIQHDYGAFRPEDFVHYRAGTLPFGESDMVAYEAIPNPGLDLPTARILTGDCFVEDENYAKRLGDKLDGELVDMETGAIAQIATKYDCPWAALRAVSDNANVGSVAEFQKNLHDAADQAARATDELLRLL